MTLLPGTQDAFGSPEYELDRQATALRKAGDWSGAIAALRERKALMGAQWQDDKLAKYLQAAGRIDEAMAEVEWLLAHSDDWARAQFGHQPASVRLLQRAQRRGQIHAAAALICKRAGRADLQGQHEAQRDACWQQVAKMKAAGIGQRTGAPAPAPEPQETAYAAQPSEGANMMKTCQKCGHMNAAATGDELEACPACGAIYSRVAAAMAARAAGAGMPAAKSAPRVEPSFVGPATGVGQPPAKRADEKFCSECGSLINAKAEICPKCGVRQMAPPTASSLGQTSASGKNKVVAGVLALLLGGLGVHKFYLGKGFQGLMYLLFCWTFIPALIGLVEGLNYLLMSEKTFFERYGA